MRKFLLLLLCIVGLVFTACRAVRVEYVPIVRDSIQVRTELRVDSVWRDRVRVERVAGDTVRIFDSVIVEKYLHRIRADTLIKRDTLTVVQEVPGPVEYRRTGYDKFCSAAFWLLLITLLITIIWRVVKFVYLRR